MLIIQSSAGIFYRRTFLTTRLLGIIKNPIGRQKWPSNYGGQMSIIGRHIIDVIDGIQPLLLAVFISILQGISLVFCSFSRFGNYQCHYLLLSLYISIM